MVTYQENPHLYVANVLEKTGNEELREFAKFILETKICDWEYYFKEAEERLSKKAYDIGVNTLAKDKDWRVRRDCARYGRMKPVEDEDWNVRRACYEIKKMVIKKIVEECGRSLELALDELFFILTL